MSPADQANHLMIDRLIAEGALWSPPLIAAFRHTPRHSFLHHVFVSSQRQEGWREVSTRDHSPADLDLIYSDRALITRVSESGVGISSSSQPSLMAEMLEDLRIEPGQRVLEIGAGTGYNAALMALIAGSGRVTSIDVDATVLAEAATHLEAFADRGVQLEQADGRDGWPAGAPFDRLMVTAATPDLEPAWLSQLNDGGVLVAPVTFAPGLSFVIRGQVVHGVFQGRLTRGAYFMPLRGEDEAPPSENESAADAEPRKTRPAPWSGWFERHKPRLSWSAFVQALVFYGWLRGLTIHYRNGPQLPVGFALRWKEAVCWLGVDEWQVSGPDGQELGDALWQALRAGGPWPTEFHLTASVGGNAQPSAVEGYVREGPRCRQVWELSSTRDRSNWR